MDTYPLTYCLLHISEDRKKTGCGDTFTTLASCMRWLLVYPAVRDTIETQSQGAVQQAGLTISRHLGWCKDNMLND